MISKCSALWLAALTVWFSSAQAQENTNATALAAPVVTAPGARASIVLIQCHGLGYGDLSCYGQKLFQTPILDQLAAEGVRFTQAYAGAPVCAPSRSVLRTGLNTGHTRVRDNFALAGGKVGFTQRRTHRSRHRI